MIGPVSIANISNSTLDELFSNYNYSVKLKSTFLKVLRTIPILSVTTFFQYGQMLHYTVTDNKIPINRFHFQIPLEIQRESSEFSTKTLSPKESYGTWIAEQELCHMVMEGNMDYQSTWNKLSATSSYSTLNLREPLRHLKDSAIVFTSLTARAAICGGLSPELAYTLNDYYIQSLESCSSIPEIQEILDGMFRDYVSRVHVMKQNPKVSRQIQDGCNYIQIHSAEKLRISDIAAQVGYAEYYFSKKFKKEMGISVNDYIKQVRVERAKIILRSKKTNIQDISHDLGFSTRSQFAEIFHKFTGMSPAEYRNKSS